MAGPIAAFVSVIQRALKILANIFGVWMSYALSSGLLILVSIILVYLGQQTYYSMRDSTAPVLQTQPTSATTTPQARSPTDRNRLNDMSVN